MGEKLYTRRQTLGLMASMAIASSCMPVKVIFNSGRETEQNHNNTLRAFAKVIIPEVQCDEPGLTEVFYDGYYPFFKYIRILAEDLDNASRKNFQTDRFSDLNLTKRTEIVVQKITAKGLTSAMYLAAAYLIQLSYYTGIYSPDRGCDLIGFQCEDQVTDSYPDIANFEGNPQTIDGNPT